MGFEPTSASVTVRGIAIMLRSPLLVGLPGIEPEYPRYQRGA